jgi:hypothetical protein
MSNPAWPGYRAILRVYQHQLNTSYRARSAWRLPNDFTNRCVWLPRKEEYKPNPHTQPDWFIQLDLAAFNLAGISEALESGGAKFNQTTGYLCKPYQEECSSGWKLLQIDGAGSSPSVWFMTLKPRSWNDPCRSQFTSTTSLDWKQVFCTCILGAWIIHRWYCILVGNNESNVVATAG